MRNKENTYQMLESEFVKQKQTNYFIRDQSKITISQIEFVNMH